MSVSSGDATFGLEGVDFKREVFDIIFRLEDFDRDFEFDLIDFVKVFKDDRIGVL